ncbi:GNVR domain-containing protein [Gallionella capsiferriformans]|nr:GNVR domain-containing protein [Gallionella capsiferriformans]
MQANQTAVQQAVQDDEINLMDLLLVIAKHNRFIIKLTLGAAVLAVIYALMQPNIYTAKTVLMPPQQPSSSTSVLLGQLGGLAGMAGGALGVKNPSDLYAGMLKSHMIEDALIKRFKLMELYQAKTMEPVRAALEGSTVVAAGKDGFITVEYSDKDPKLAAAIANAYVEELDSLVRTQAAREALGRKQFYEKQLADVRAGLGRAELEMKVFQDQNRVFQLGGGAGVALGASGGIPKAELEYVRIARDVKYNEMLLAAMAQQVTSATIDAAKNLPTLQVLDKALVPEKKSKPKRAMIVMLATILAFFIGIIWAFVREAGERSGQNPEQNERMNMLRRYFRQGK